MAKYSYYTVVMNHENGELFTDRFAEEWAPGVLWDSESAEWTKTLDENSQEKKVDDEGYWRLEEALRISNQISKDNKEEDND